MMVSVATSSWKLPSILRFCHCYKRRTCRIRRLFQQRRTLCNTTTTNPTSTSENHLGSEKTEQRETAERTLLSANEIRSAFIEYFRDNHEHVVVPSASVIPHRDATLLFTNAGMNQFKDVFLGTVGPHSEFAQYRRVVNSQKCIRAGGKHNDLDDVGKDGHHHTFFEMLGNWSFGDYFKREACSMAWDLLTRIYGLPKDQLYITYFGGDPTLNLPADTECRDIWLELGVPAERILPAGISENFWEMGGSGPCGPCSEIHYDRHRNRDASSLVNDPRSDVLEVWNLVFMEYIRVADGSLRQLPQQHVDAGMGLERLVAILQGVDSNYDTDLFQPLIKAIEKRSGAQPYHGLMGTDDPDYVDTAYRALADHARMLTVAIADGGQPDYFKRGYVLKRVIRRAVRYATEKLHAPPGLLASLVPVVIESLGSAYPELRCDPEHIMDIINAEENQFMKTLRRGQKFLQKHFARLPKGSMVPGDVAWKMYDGFGFPLDLTTMVAEEHGVKVDVEGYEVARLKAHEITSQGGIKNVNPLPRIRLDATDLSVLQKKKTGLTDDSLKYNNTYTESGKYVFPAIRAKVLALKTERGFTNMVASGEECGVILDCTNFYAEQGGQEWDEGHLNSVKNEEVVFQVENVQTYGGYVLHVGTAVETIRPGDHLMLFLNEVRRQKIMHNHTATHILNFALREVIGEIEQRGSLVAQDRLRFDFTAKSALDQTQLQEVTKIANDLIATGQKVYRGQASLEAVKSTAGVRALFDEAYGDHVTLVSVGVPVEEALEGSAAMQYPVELCVGNHVCNTSHVKKLIITAQRQVSAGVRRVTAVTGNDAQAADYLGNTLQQRIAETGVQLESTLRSETLEGMAEVKQSLESSMRSLDSASLELWRKINFIRQVETMREKIKKAERRLERLKIKQIARQLGTDFTDQTSTGKTTHQFLIKNVAGEINSKTLLEIGKEVTKLLPDTPLMLVGGWRDNVAAVCIVPENSNMLRLKANTWMESVSQLMGSEVEGRVTFARTQGKGRHKVKDCLAVAEDHARSATFGD